MDYKISVIIVNYNVKDLLLACIGSLYMDLTDEEVEVIVVDNNSSDGSKDFILAKFPKVKWIGNDHNAGFSAANNQGMRAATSDLFFVLNPDTELKQNVLTGLIGIHKKNPGNVIIPQLLNTDGTLQISCWKFPAVWGVVLEALYLHIFFNPYNYPIEKFETQFSPDSASGAAMLFGRNVFQATGGLDEDLFWSEDIDFCYVATKKGMPLLYFPDQKIFHHSGKSSKANFNIPISNQLLSKAKYLRKHKGWFTWLVSVVFIFIHIISRMIVFSILSLSGNETYAKKRRAYFFTLKKHFQYVFLNSKSLT